MKLKRLLAMTLAFAMMFSIGAVSVAADISTYNDLPDKNAWYYDAIISAIQNDVITSDNGFIRPSEYITVDQMYTYAGNALGVKLSAPSNSSSIAVREDLFVLLAELVGAELSTYDSVDTYLKNFGDYASISSSARTPIAALIKAGYITGVISGGTASIYPKNQLSRAEFAVLAHRIFGQYVNSPGTVTNNVTGNITVRSPGVTLSGNSISGDVIIGGNARTIDLALSNSTISGRTIVRGNAALTANARSTVGVVHTYADLAFSGDATTINVRGQALNIKLSGGWLRNLNLESDNNVVSVDNYFDVAYCAIGGSGNAVSGNGTIGNVNLGGSNNKFEVAGANIAGDTGRNNITSTKTGTFNITDVEFVSNTQIRVTFDAKIETAPASAFALSGTAKSYTKSSTATPNTTSISGSTVTLTFTGANFYDITNPNNAATITVTDAVISSEKGKLNIKTITGGYGSGSDDYYDELVNFTQINKPTGGPTVSQEGNSIDISYTSANLTKYGAPDIIGDLEIKFTVNDARYFEYVIVDGKTSNSAIQVSHSDINIESYGSSYSIYDIEVKSNGSAYRTDTNKVVSSYTALLTIAADNLKQLSTNSNYRFAVEFYPVKGNGSLGSKKTYYFNIYVPKG